MCLLIQQLYRVKHNHFDSEGNGTFHKEADNHRLNLELTAVEFKAASTNLVLLFILPVFSHILLEKVADIYQSTSNQAVEV